MVISTVSSILSRTTRHLHRLCTVVADQCSAVTIAFAAALLVAISGCGGGGYAGGGIASLSATSFVLDAGQSVNVTATVKGSYPVAWAFAGTTCSGAACGALSASTGATVTYTAPAGVAQPMQVTLLAEVPKTKSQETVTITVNPDPTLTGAPPAGIVGSAYTATIVSAGGTSPLATIMLNGSLPPGLGFNAATGVISGTPTAIGTFAFTVQLTDSSSVPYTVTANKTINVSNPVPPLSLIGGPQPLGEVGIPYTTAFIAAGGVTPYTFSIVSGTLPAGLSLATATGVVSGTPTTVGTSNFTVQVKDSTSATATAAASITVISPLSLLGGRQPDGVVGVAYSTSLVASGGVTPYSWSIISGTLPSGLSISPTTGAIAGVPATVGTSNFTVQVKDSLGATATAAASIRINSPLAISNSLPNGTVGVAYNATINASGGTTPYACSISAGTLPAGLILNACTVSGTPTTAGPSTITVAVTDASSPQQSASRVETIVISPAPLTLTMSNLPSGTVGVPYSATIGVSGGISPYSCVITAGTLPAGLSISGCTVSGTPTIAGTSTVTVNVTDSESPTQSTTGPETIVINPAALTLVNTLPDGTVGVVYSATIDAAGGTTPYSCSITAGALPAGLSLSGCTVSGTPTTPGTSNITVKVTDTGNPTKTVSGPESITIHPSGTLSLTASLPNAIVGVPYSYTLKATGGTSPYTYALTAGSLPPGVTLQADGLISGTPTKPGASSFTATVTDSVNATASDPLILLVEYPTTPYDAELDGPYAFLFQGYDDVVAGVIAYQTATAGSFIADGIGGINLGELDSNHQSSNPSGTTVISQNFIGTYEVNADSRGFITITTLNPDGTTDQTFTYAIALKAPVSPATASTQGNLIEFDNDQLVGTKGSGQLLAQTPSAFSAGLNGSYAFGLSGDTPCLISCTVGIASGPVATVGAFTTDGAGKLTAGTADANIASSNFANAPLSGAYQAADQNGRLQMEMTNTSISDGLYPTDFAIYMVNANQAFVLSIDKHSEYTLLAGTAQAQTSSSFSNASMNGAFVGYENAQSNPGLLGTTLQGVLNYSTATVFRASGNGSGSCNTTNVDSGGVTSLVDNLTGLSSSNKNNLLNALLGSYGATGSSSCTVSANGRGVFNYPDHSGLISTLLSLLGLPAGPPDARVVYLSGPNQGYFLETGYAGLGHIESQTGAPFSLASLKGTYVEGTIPASSLASINDSGYFIADGSGNATYTLDENVGVGTLNVLQLGTTATTTYSLSDPNNNVTAAAAGRYVLADGTTVIYAISPGKFVLVDTNPLTTSPGVSLLY